MQRHLFDAVDLAWHGNTEEIHQRRGHVDDMVELPPGLAPGIDALRPPNDERCANPAGIGISLVAFEGRVAGHGPADRIVVVGERSAHVVQPGEVGFDAAVQAVARALVVIGAVGSAGRARAVVRDGQHDGVFALAEIVDLLEQATDLHVGVVEEPGEDLLEPGRKALLVAVQVVPHIYAGIARCQALVPVGNSAEAFCRARILDRAASQPSSNLPRYLSA